MTRKSIILIITVIVVLLGAMFAYWYFFFNGPGATVINTGDNQGTGFTPLNRPSTGNNATSVTNGNTVNSTSTIKTIKEKIPTLRLLSNTPVGGYGASTTPNIASTTKIKGVKGTTVVRWIDRGRGNILEARGDTNEIVTISNTTLPRVYESVWNRDLTAFIGTLFAENANSPTTIYSQLKAVLTPKAVKNATSTATSTISATPLNSNIVARAPFELKGKNLPDKMISYAVSPKGDKIFMLVNESNSGVGYIANFDGSSVTRIFNTPLTQLNVDWPEADTIAITTKGSATQSGFLYFINPKTGIWKRILGPINGLSTRVSHDAKQVIYSYTNSKKDMLTSFYDIKKLNSTDAVVRTLADKCTWGNFYKETVFCAAPSQIITASYPDDWYKGNVSFIDKIWQINSTTGDIHQISSIVDQSDRVIDVYNLGLDSRDDFLFFMNKNDLTLWSFDLVSSN